MLGHHSRSDSDWLKFSLVALFAAFNSSLQRWATTFNLQLQQFISPNTEMRRTMDNITILLGYRARSSTLFETFSVQQKPLINSIKTGRYEPTTEPGCNCLRQSNSVNPERTKSRIWPSEQM